MVVIAFMMPVEPQRVTGFIILFSLATLISFKAWDFRIFKSFPFLVKATLISWAAFFFFHLLSLTWTTHIDQGYLDVSRKLNMIFLPFLLIVLPIDERTIFRILKAFLIGVFLSVILNLLNSIVQYQEIHKFYVFTGAFAIRNIHLGYYAVFLIFSMALIADFFLSSWLQGLKWKWVYLFLGICSIPILVLSGSKMGFFILTGLIFFLIFFVLRGKDWKKVLLFPLLAICILGLAVTQTQHLKDRLRTMYERTFYSPILPESTESTMARRMTWKSAIEVWSASPVLGCGAGDIDAEMDAKYDELGFNGPREKGLNPHSQYLQSGAALGLIGFLLLLASVMFPLIHSLRKGQFSVIAFFIILLLVNVTESALERQAGLQFFTFFTPILLIWTLIREKNSEVKKDLLNLWPF
jgi:O-antigen ligase